MNFDDEVDQQIANRATAQEALAARNRQQESDDARRRQRLSIEIQISIGEAFDEILDGSKMFPDLSKTVETQTLSSLGRYRVVYNRIGDQYSIASLMSYDISSPLGVVSIVTERPAELKNVHIEPTRYPGLEMYIGVGRIAQQKIWQIFLIQFPSMQESFSIDTSSLRQFLKELVAEVKGKS